MCEAFGCYGQCRVGQGGMAVRGDREYEVIGDGTSLCILAWLFILICYSRF